MTTPKKNHRRSLRNRLKTREDAYRKVNLALTALLLREHGELIIPPEAVKLAAAQPWAFRRTDLPDGGVRLDLLTQVTDDDDRPRPTAL